MFKVFHAVTVWAFHSELNFVLSDSYLLGDDVKLVEYLTHDDDTLFYEDQLIFAVDPNRHCLKFTTHVRGSFRRLHQKITLFTFNTFMVKDCCCHALDIQLISFYLRIDEESERAKISSQWKFHSVEFVKKLSNLKSFSFSSMPLSLINTQTKMFVTNRCNEYMYQLTHTNLKLIGYHTQYEGETHKKSEIREMIKRCWYLIFCTKCKCICTTHIQISIGCGQYLALKMEIEIGNFCILCICVSRCVCVANCQRFHILCLFGVHLSCFKFILKLEQLVNVDETSKHDTSQQGKNPTVAVRRVWRWVFEVTTVNDGVHYE